jgi:hypothetical protein
MYHIGAINWFEKSFCSSHAINQEFNSKLLAEVAAAFPDDAQAISGAREMIRKQREGAKK